jgi:SnoaL-like domain
MHFNTNVLIEFQTQERAFVETYVLVLQRFDDRRATASARYLDRFEKRNGKWAVVHRTLVFGDIVPEPMSEPPRFPPEFTEQKHGMDDPLYALKGKR